MSQDTLQAKLAYLVARTNMVKSLGPLQRLQHVDELVALQLDLLDAIIERIDDVPPRKWWCQLSNSSVTKRCESLGETCPICNLFYE